MKNMWSNEVTISIISSVNFRILSPNSFICQQNVLFFIISFVTHLIKYSFKIWLFLCDTLFPLNLNDHGTFHVYFHNKAARSLYLNHGWIIIIIMWRNYTKQLPSLSKKNKNWNFLHIFTNFLDFWLIWILKINNSKHNFAFFVYFFQNFANYLNVCRFLIGGSQLNYTQSLA